MSGELHIDDSQFQYIARISHGKDSLKMLDVIVSRGLRLDRITTTDIWATDTIRGEHPEMVKFKERADEYIWRKYRIEVEHLCAIRNGEKVTYEKAPFILHQVVTGEDAIGNTNKGSGLEIRLGLQSSAVIRSVFCVYHPDEQVGGLALLNIMEEMRIALLMYPTLNGVFELDLREGISQMAYPETGERGTAPFYLGEMVTAWKLPPVRRLDAARVTQGLPPTDPKDAHYINKISGKE